MQLPDIIVSVDEGKIIWTVTDHNNPSSNNFKRTVGEAAATDQTFHFLVENLRLLPRAYNVRISDGVAANFVSDNVQYWIAMENVK